MGLGGISLWQLLIVLVIVIVIFGTKRLSSIGTDLGGAVKGFRKSMSDVDKDDDKAQIDTPDAEFSETPSDATSKSDTSQKV
ncbi:MAG: twin-arginine translocase TatA/TatE family subunit [Gammaproteobacteria bacterium]|nr:twin-arginine translocase TatA/TatE family subunit [Gammaproteobacteria bacterium]MCP4088747.1 twin-arginine translocase TatA/TatE family subunit [Gammaproteobacteria bacterium]MCP4275210.1 twin-arginine translocase TatA/TatE family subunit [Gammaproteobacteria bacterium]MCP4830780.1 twin-arginine translocase TatA/TatE family subunit [Gammaproteobacteria bacterium]MCP4929569.1 twin-arginine translocase TatA/TatE family subunit [Gammaproteobacteria bacterium]